MLLLHLPQVRLVAKSIWDRARFAVELEDLIGYGTIGLLRAMQRFDPARGVLLKTYAEHRIRGAILDGLRGMDWLPRSARQKERQYQQQQRETEIASLRPPGHPIPSLMRGANGIPHPESNGGRANGVPRMEIIFAGGNLADLEKLSEKRQTSHWIRGRDGNPEILYQRKQEHQRLADAISRLPRRQRDVIGLYYHRELTMKQIGQILRIHESRVSQLHAAALHRLRNHLAAGKAVITQRSKPRSQSYSQPPRSSFWKCRATASQSSSVSTPMVSSAVSAT